jgi:hypothetical protein
MLRELLRLSRPLAVIGVFASLPGNTLAAARSSFEVTDETPTLSEVGLFLYGESRMGREIANWNGIPRPFHIRLGQILVLRVPPALTPNEGSQRLLKMWRKRFGLSEELPHAQARQGCTVASNDEDTLIEKGQIASRENRHEDALGCFRAVRQSHPRYLPAWFLELRELKILKREPEATELAIRLLESRPELKELEPLRSYLKKAPLSLYGAPP